MGHFEYIGRTGVEQFRYYRIPKYLIENEQFREISTDAKLLYGLLLDRLELSIRNNWFDECGHAYTIFTIKDVEDRLNCGHSKAVRLMKELDTKTGVGLIRRVRNGLGMPDWIYVFNFLETKKEEKLLEVSKQDILKYSNNTSGCMKTEHSEVFNADSKEQERNELKRKEPELREKKDAYGAFSNVYLSADEMELLKREFPYDYGERIEALSDYIAAKGKRYKNHLAVIRSWDRRERRRYYPSIREEHYETEESL